MHCGLTRNCVEGLRRTTNKLRIANYMVRIRIRHFRTQLYTNIATLILSVILHEKLTVAQLVTKFPAVHATQVSLVRVQNLFTVPCLCQVNPDHTLTYCFKINFNIILPSYRLWGPPTLLLSGCQDSSPVSKRREREVNSTPAPSAAIKEWRYTPIIPLCLHGVDGETSPFFHVYSDPRLTLHFFPSSFPVSPLLHSSRPCPHLSSLTYHCAMKTKFSL